MLQSWVYFFWVEDVELNLSTLLRGGVREIGAQLLSLLLSQTKQYLLQDPLGKCSSFAAQPSLL